MELQVHGFRIQEKVIKDRKSREAKDVKNEANLASTNVSIGTSSGIGKGKYPVEEFPQTSMEK